MMGDVDVKTVTEIKRNETDGQIATPFGHSHYYIGLDDRKRLQKAGNPAELSNE